MITGKDLIDWGFRPAPWFKEAIKAANIAVSTGGDPKSIVESIRVSYIPAPQLLMKDKGEYFINIDGSTEDELTNIEMCKTAMEELVKVPTIVGGALMPDACPAGVIPVGGVIAAKNAIHPGFHSADICCSVAVAVLGKVNPKDVLDRAMKVTHFGVGGRAKNDWRMPSKSVIDAMEANKILQWHVAPAVATFATQGDGNHFLYVGQIESTGDTVVVTHHGSRTVGARLYKKGMDIAESYRQKLAPTVPKGMAWIPADSEDGQEYWEAMQIMKEWTRESHFEIHRMIGYNINDWFWNEHNFVFQRDDGLFYHAKGATPGWDDYDTTIVPLNMAEPILLTRGTDNPNALGFLPHGAGRNLSRTAYNKRIAGRTPESLIQEQAPGIDVRFFSGKPDTSELPFAYKNANEVVAQIEKFKLATIVDKILPYGSIMAGDQGEKPWLNNKAKRSAIRNEYKREKREQRHVEKQKLHNAIREGNLELFD